MNNERIYEVAKFGQALAPQAVSGTLYNGSSSGTTNNGIDLKGFDGITVLLNAGSWSSSAACACTTVSSDTNDPATATLCTGTDGTTATFTALSTSEKNLVQRGFVWSGIAKRYCWLKTVMTGSGDAYLAADYVLGRGTHPPEQVRSDATWNGNTETKTVMDFVVDDSV